MKTLSSYWWLLLGFVTNTIFRYKPFSYEYFVEGIRHYSFLTAQALSFMFFFLFGIFKKERAAVKWERILSIVVVAGIISNVIDEAYYDPLTFGANEYFIVFAAYVCAIFEKQLLKWLTS